MPLYRIDPAVPPYQPQSRAPPPPNAAQGWLYKAGSYADDGAGYVSIPNNGTTTLTLGTAVAVGDVIVVGIMGGNTSTSDVPSFTVTDNVNTGNYAEDRTQTLGSYAASRQSVFRMVANAAGTPTITVRLTLAGGFGFGGMAAAAWTGLAATSPLDVSAANTGVGTSASSGATGATGGANELVIGFISDLGENCTITAGSGFTSRGVHQNDGSHWQGGLEDQDSGGAASTPNGTWTKGASTTWLASTVVYKLATPAGGGARTATPVTASIYSPAYQHLIPASDVSNPGGYTDQTGGTTNLFAALDEPYPANDTDYVQTPLAPSSAQYTTRLGNLGSAPQAGNRVLHIRYFNDVDGGQLNFTFDLMQSTTVLQSFGPYPCAVGAALELDVLVTATITDWTTPFDLRVTITQSA